MNTTISESICLALLVRPGDRLPIKTLTLAKPFINSWCIYTEHVSKAEQRSIRTLMFDCDGEFIQGDMHHYGKARTELVEHAQELADWVLLLHSGEQICSREPNLSLPLEARTAKLAIGCEPAMILEHRLFRSDINVTYPYPVGGRPLLDIDSTETISSWHVISERLEEASLSNNVTNHFLLEAVLGEYAPSAELSLILAKLELANSQLELAIEHLLEVIDSNTDRQATWMAHYLLGGSFLKLEQPEKAITHWHAAFEMDPNRAEPLMRLAELHIAKQDYPTADLLLEQIGTIHYPTDVAYVEPQVYEYKALLLLAKVKTKLGLYDDAVFIIDCLDGKALNQQTLEAVKALRAQVNSQAENESPDVVQFAPEALSNVKRKARARITVGMATHDDYDGVYFSVMSLVLYHQEVLNDIEILIIDNNPNSKHGQAVRGLAERVSQMRYVAAEEYQGTAIRERVFHEASSDFVVCMDCHVFLHPGALQQLIAFFEDDPERKDLLHGPIYYDNHDDYSTHMEPVWQSGFYGRWASDERGAELNNPAFEIPMQGLGLFACVKKHWPGFNLRFRGFGGEEGYIHEKCRVNGGRVLCLPFLRWTHRFDRPNSPKYNNSWTDRIRNYLIGWDEVGLEINQVLDHFSELLGDKSVGEEYAKFLTEQRSPLCNFDTILFYGGKKSMDNELESLGIGRVISVVNDPEIMRANLMQATQRGLPNILIIDIKQPYHDTFIDSFINSLDDIAKLPFGEQSINTVDKPEFQAVLVKPEAYDFVARQFDKNGCLKISALSQRDYSVESKTAFLN